MTSQSLPKEFKELECWCSRWALSNSDERSRQRQNSTLDELEEFYSSLLPLAEKALVHLSGFKLGELPKEEALLLKLLLSLAEVTPAIEWYGQPRVIDGLDPERFPAALLLKDLSP
ncbi:hypothetical protein MK292_00940 [Myxococcota bacterium]|nr:hypothetical protein [Myxococcota bacterium]|tara:strand:- start:183 stop:530 length:348 start_codon:yes stop_codon:yes gene_type:complete